MNIIIVLAGLLVAITFNLMMSSNSLKEKSQKKISVEDFELIFRKERDIDKFINEYRELITWLNEKYPSFKEDVKDDYWIQRIIEDHDEILINLRELIKDEKNKWYFRCV